MKGAVIKIGKQTARYPRSGEVVERKKTTQKTSAFDSLSKTELYMLAKKRKLKVTTKLTKGALIKALEEG